MLFHWLVDRDSGTDLEQIVADLHEPVERDRLETAWQQAVDSFSALRTAFEWEGQASPTQHIEPEAAIHLPFQDLRHLRPADAEDAIQMYLREDRRNGFDLSRAPAMRIALFQMEDSRYRMIWSVHHILIDGRAFEVILNAVFAAYETGEPVRVADRPYREYIDWVDRQETTPSREFWRTALAGYTATTPLPYGAPSTDENADRFGQKTAALSVETTSGLRELSIREGLSPNTIVMTAWAFLLARYTGEWDIVFGATKTTRRGTIPNAHAIVGQFLATVPVRIALNPDSLVIDALKAMRAFWTALRGFEHLPLVDIKQSSELPPSAPLFNTLVVFENYLFGTKLNSQGGAWANRHISLLEQTNFPLAFMAYDGDALVMKIDFDARRFDEATIDRMLGHLTSILDSWARSTSDSLWRTQMLTDGERHQLLHTLNATSAAYPRDIPLADLVEEQVRRSPDALAVTYQGVTITYAELNTRANQLAHELLNYHVGPDHLVGICLERSIEMMIALLAVIKAGAAYVPLDPLFPPERLAYMVADSGLRVLITQRSLRSCLPVFTGAVVEVDRERWMDHSSSDLAVAVGPESLAFVIYTSGSTGKPKGVQIRRAALTNLLWSMRTWLQLTSRDRVLATTTISFDIAGVDVWLPWLVGASTIIASREAAADGEQLRALLDKHDITFLQATPVTWRLLFEAEWKGKRDLQCVCTGEAMPPDLAALLVRNIGRLWNLYGPTETTIWSTGYAVVDVDGPVPIGRPVGNTRCYILDEHQQLQPIGTVGELYLAGDGLARGYLNRADLTAERFVPDPFDVGRGARMYRTGDLARYRDDGNIECLGRTDHQVKIRGFRIELGEIESLLKQHPKIREAVVIAREDTQGDRRLAAYLVPEGELPGGSELRGYLKQSLPDYMVPAAYVQLDSIPLTANGKIDRRALPAPGSNSGGPERVVALARNYVEKQLSEIWEAMFSMSPVSITDNFFDLGGHSLLALRLMSKITQVFGRQLPLNTLFVSPTIEQLAKHLQGDQKTVGRHTLVSIQASGTRPPIYWIPGGAALGLFSLRHIVTRLGADQPVYGLGSNYPKSLDDVERVEERAQNYLELVRQVQPHGPYCFAGFCAGGRVAFEMAQQLRTQGEVMAFLGLINCWFPNYPETRVARLVFRLQRMREHLRSSRDNRVGLLDDIRQMVAGRRAARLERAKTEAARIEVARSGFQQRDTVQNQVLLNRVTEVFDLYTPRFYAGRVSLFISDDPDVAGVGPSLDPRFAWARCAASHEVRRFAGGHQAVLEMPYAVGFAESLKAALDDALDRHHSGESAATSACDRA